MIYFIKIKWVRGGWRNEDIARREFPAPHPTISIIIPIIISKIPNQSQNLPFLANKKSFISPLIENLIEN